MTAVERFKKFVTHDPTTGCMPWLGSKSYDGYPLFWGGESCVRAHRWVYEYLVEQIPVNKEIDHLCRNRCCVNITHLEIVDHQTNVLRGETIVAAQLKRTRCPQGHAYDSENTYWYGRNRQCKACNSNRALRQRKVN